MNEGTFVEKGDETGRVSTFQPNDAKQLTMLSDTGGRRRRREERFE